MLGKPPSRHSPLASRHPAAAAKGMVPLCHCKLEGNLHFQEAQGDAVALAAGVHPRAAGRRGSWEAARWQQQRVLTVQQQCSGMQSCWQPGSTHMLREAPGREVRAAPAANCPKPTAVTPGCPQAAACASHLYCCDTMASTAAHSSTMPHTWEEEGEQAKSNRADALERYTRVVMSRWHRCVFSGAAQNTPVSRAWAGVTNLLGVMCPTLGGRRAQ